MLRSVKMTTKICSKCYTEKDIIEFGKRRGDCKDCCNFYMKLKREVKGRPRLRPINDREFKPLNYIVQKELPSIAGTPTYILNIANLPRYNRIAIALCEYRKFLKFSLSDYNKVCGNCKILKNGSEFHKDKGEKDGLRYECIVCKREKYFLNKKKKDDYPWKVPQFNEIIRKYKEGGISQAQLGRDYNLSRSHINKIVRGKYLTYDSYAKLLLK